LPRQSGNTRKRAASWPERTADRGAEKLQPRTPSIETTGHVTGVDGNLASVSLAATTARARAYPQVYRTSPNPVYLGTLTITQVQPHQAAGRLEPSAKGKNLAINDTVDTRILHLSSEAIHRVECGNSLADHPESNCGSRECHGGPPHELDLPLSVRGTMRMWACSPLPCWRW